MATDPYVNAPRSAITPPEVVRSEAVDLEVVPDHMNPGSPPTVGTDEKFSYHDEKLQTETRVLGLKPLVFWLMTLLVAAILAVGIGAGLGVGLPSRSKSAETTMYEYQCQSPLGQQDSGVMFIASKTAPRLQFPASLRPLLAQHLQPRRLVSSLREAR